VHKLRKSWFSTSIIAF